MSHIFFNKWLQNLFRIYADGIDNTITIQNFRIPVGTANVYKKEINTSWTMKISYEMLPKNVKILLGGIPKLYIVITRAIGKILTNIYSDWALPYV